MATKKQTTNKKEEGSMGLGIALAAAAAAAAAGAYFLYGSKDAKKNRKAVKGWVIKAKGEVVEKLEKIKGEITEENFNKIVDDVMVKYYKAKAYGNEEVEELTKDMKKHWKNIKSHVGGATKKKPVAKKKATTKKAA